MSETPTAKVAEFHKLHSAEQKRAVLCAQAQRCYEQGLTVALHVATAKDAIEMDKALWTFSDQTFLPHVRASHIEEPVLEPIIIYCGNEPMRPADVLIEAAGGAPGDRFRPFERVMDFAEVYDEALREQSRARFKACQEAGYRMRFVE